MDIKIFIGSAGGAEHSQTLYQSNIVYEYLIQNNYKLVKSPKEADYILLNGYPFDLYEEKISLIHIYYYLTKYSDKKIIIFGSIPDMIFGIRRLKRKFENLEFIGYANYVLFEKIFPGKKSISDIDAGLIRFFMPLKIESISLGDLLHNGLGDNLCLKSDYKLTDNDFQITVDQILNGEYFNYNIQEYSYDFNYMLDNKENYYIEATHGCGFDCDYCAIKRVYGSIKSLPLDDILTKIKKALSRGVKNIIFIDEDVASYGQDIGLSFADLINEINKINGDFKVRFYYLEPKHFIKYFDKIDLSFRKNRLGYARITLQTTSSRILKLMNRSYDIQKAVELSNYIKHLNKDVQLGSIVIYGYPTETFNEFKDYFKLTKIYDCVDFLLYQPKKGTKSYDLPRNSYEEILKKNIYLLKMKRKLGSKIDPVIDDLKEKMRIIKYCYLNI